MKELKDSEIKTSPPKKPLIFYYLAALIVLMLLNVFLFPSLLERQVVEVPYSQFLTMVDGGQVEQVALDETSREIVFIAKDDGGREGYYKTGVWPDDGQRLLAQLQAEEGITFTAEIPTQANPILSFLVSWILPIVIFIVIGELLSRWMMKRMGGLPGGMGNAMTFGKSGAKVYVEEASTGVSFADVAGQDEAKESLMEVVDFLHGPEKYAAIGARLPKGVLLVGPPGTGKTLLAKAVAGEAKVPFFSISGSEFVEMFVGMGAAKVRDLFKQAGEKAPCIVFIDEIDAIGKKRDTGGLGGNDEREQTLNQLLAEMDGFDSSKGVVLLAATNRPESLDPALLRPGRFDRRVPVELPDLQGRIAILKVHGRRVHIDGDVDWSAIGARLPKGVLLVGPPGTGKTLLAKAVAGEAKVPFFSISGSEFVEMFVGMGAAKVRDLFKQAGEKAPCIVFIDEIDAIGKKRDTGGLGGNDEREQTLNQLLAEMDGFDSSKGVVLLAATNRPESLDPALLRPGRFDRRVPVELPDLQGRIAILKVHGRRVHIDGDVDWSAIARATAGASGAELANIVNEGALRAVRLGRKTVTQADLEESVETVIAGAQRKNAVISPQEKQIVSHHEVGHALVAALQSHSAPVTKITIIPRTSGALGYTMQVDEGEKMLMSRTELENKLATLTGGRAAEELIFGPDNMTTGASNDIEQATKLARAMITRYGMTEEFDMVALETVQNQYLGGDAALSCSAETAAAVDRQVVELVRAAHQKALGLLRENESKLRELAGYLLEKETITGEEFMERLRT